ncbi:3-oxo-Delta(4,5)-steroid 5-beta-reductase [Daldinia childiae]|uniref:3-oxo-Delta(4,5)-steroid 5-beta-reductase n=1 Tax=Daldinia childiae TaxID=326645 RepID=UPI001446B979|nr:3-oxo-Delta(4,5)-steroid 5-beta-reductase [Daldinia childiae]KAF3069710.1 3-oxo-Delta(4,5)-steroid 5-beta-reductase [Daldinia childiae]
MCSNSLDSKDVALIFGASGITGWPLMRECLSYPSKNTFSRVLGLSNRPLSRETAYLPDDPRLEIYTGIDLLDKDQTRQTLETIPAIGEVTHVYFVAYTGHGRTAEELVRLNSALVDHALLALKKLCPRMKFFTLQTGGKGYATAGVPWPPAPWKEDLPRLPEPYASKIFYYAVYDVMIRHAAGSSWQWSEIRPSYLPGFTPHHNAMSIAHSLGLFIAFYRSVKGAGATCAFPGTPGSWEALHSDSSQDVVAHFHIYTSLHGDKTHGRSFNVADGEGTSWKVKWPIVCNYFGLKGVGPSAQVAGELQGTKWLLAQKYLWSAWAKDNGLKGDVLENMQWDILDTALSLPLRIDYDLGASREIGFQETMDVGKGFLVAFDRLRRAKFLP